MRRLLAICLGFTLIATLVLTKQAATASVTDPCPAGYDMLWSRHEASADFYDSNSDGLECFPAAYESRPPDGPNGTDNDALGAAFRGYRFFMWYPNNTNRADTYVSAVYPAENRFEALIDGQEDDPDWNGCQFVCLRSFAYDSADYFYVDYGQGSIKVSLQEFENQIAGERSMSINYSPTAASNIFMLNLVYSSRDAVAPQAVASMTLNSPTQSTLRVAWTAPQWSGGSPITRYRVGWEELLSGGRTWEGQAPHYQLSESPLTLTNLRPSTSYRVWVIPVNAKGFGPSTERTAMTSAGSFTPTPTPTVTVTQPPPPPPQPTVTATIPAPTPTIIIVPPFPTTTVTATSKPTYAPIKTFRSCAAMHRVKAYKGGIAKTRYAANHNVGGTLHYKAYVSKVRYKLNKARDRDGDRIACER